MEGKENFTFFTDVISSLKSHLLAVSVACIGLILISYGLITSLMPKQHSSDISFETEASSVKKSDQNLEKKGNIVVDVSGAVKKPGVYRLLENARIEDALVAAGGFSSDADLDWTQHSLNLAAKVSDGMKIYIPRIGEEMHSITPLRQGFVGQASTTGESGGIVAGVSTNGLVSVNNASQSELEDLPGIGPVTAGKIIDNRPYGSIDELLSKKAVGKSVFEKIKELVSL